MRDHIDRFVNVVAPRTESLKSSTCGTISGWGSWRWRDQTKNLFEAVALHGHLFVTGGVNTGTAIKRLLEVARPSKCASDDGGTAQGKISRWPDFTGRLLIAVAQQSKRLKMRQLHGEALMLMAQRIKKETYSEVVRQYGEVYRNGGAAK